MKLFLFVSTLFLTACSSVKESTLAQMDGKDRPDWASQSKVVTLKDGKMLILGFQEMDAGAKISAAFRLADNAARTELSTLIQTQFSSILQNLEEGVEDGGNLTRFYSSEVSKNLIRDLKINSRYWEKVQTFDGDGQKTYRLRLYSLAEIPEGKFRALMRESLEKNKISEDLKAKVLDHFDSEIKQFQKN